LIQLPETSCNVYALKDGSQLMHLMLIVFGLKVECDMKMGQVSVAEQVILEKLGLSL
jgi:hypothetical protein